MSRGSVFKLSGNLALGGGNDTYSTNQLQSIKSSLRLLKARQSQKKSQQNIDYNNNNNYGGSYSSNTAQRSDLRKDQNKDYNYFQSNAKNHIPMSNYDNQNYGTGYDRQQYNKTNSRNNLYDNQRNQIPNNKNNNYPSNNRNDFPANNKNNYPQNNRNDYSNQNDYIPYSYNNPNELSARNGNKARTQQPKPYHDQHYSQQQPIINKNQQDSRPKAQTRPPLRKQQLNHQASNYNNQSSQPQEKPIKQANLQAKQDIVEYDPSTFVQCSVGCGRKFNPDSISKHQAICYKVFQKKRKQFNAQQQRILDGQHKKIVKNVVAEQKRNTAVGKKSKKPEKDDEKMSKWKAQSLAFRAMLKNNRGDQQTAEQKQKMQEIKNMGMIKCPHCGRSFNQNSGPKHIAFCETQSKKNKMKR